MRGSRFGLVLGLTTALAALGCGGDDGDKGAGGAGGTASGGAGGTTSGGGGTTGTGGTGGSPAAGACQFPKCIADIAADCVPIGSCVTSTSQTGSSNVCYSNGVKMLTSVSITGTMPSAMTRVTKPNGSTCYTIDIPLAGAQSGMITMTWKNASGATVATGTVGQDGAWTITCTGQAPVRVTGCNMMGMPSMGTGGSAGSSCTQGACM